LGCSPPPRHRGGDRTMQYFASAIMTDQTVSLKHAHDADGQEVLHGMFPLLGRAWLAAGPAGNGADLEQRCRRPRGRCECDELVYGRVVDFEASPRANDGDGSSSDRSHATIQARPSLSFHPVSRVSPEGRRPDERGSARRSVAPTGLFHSAQTRETQRSSPGDAPYDADHRQTQEPHGVKDACSVGYDPEETGQEAGYVGYGLDNCAACGPTLEKLKI